MKKLISILFFSMIIVSSVIAQVPEREFRATWIATLSRIDWPKTVVSDSTNATQIANQQKELTDILDQLVNANLNAVFLQIRPMADALYSSSLVPWSVYLSGTRGNSPGYDPLAFAIAECHKRGIELHAWMNPYRYTNSSTTHPQTDYILAQHPDWVLAIGSESILNPGLPAVRTHIAEVTAEVLHRYPEIDGVVWDDYFYLSSITNQDNSAFLQYNPSNLSLADWRRDNVNRTVEQVYDTIKNINPGIRFGISPRGIWSISSAAAQKYGVTLPQGITGADNYNSIYCDALAWMSAKTIDYISPQLYWPSYQTAQDYRVLSPWWQDMADRYGVDYYASQALYRGFPMTEVGLEIGVNRTADNVSPGSIFYNTTYFLKDSVIPYLRANYFQNPTLTPEFDDYGQGTQAVISQLYFNSDSTEISWTSDTDEGSYAIYLVPNNPRGNPFQYLTYFIARSYDTQYDITSYKSRLGSEWFAVAPINRYLQIGSALTVEGEPVFVEEVNTEKPLYYTTYDALHVELNQAAMVVVYGVNGYCWYRGETTSLILNLPQGVYILQINGICYKIVK